MGEGGGGGGGALSLGIYEGEEELLLRWDMLYE